MEIQGNGFVLRAWKREDAIALAKIANNKKIYDNLRDGFPHPYTLEDAKGFIEAAIQDNGNGRSLLLAIEIDGVLGGSMGAFMKDDIYRLNAEIGYYLAEEYWGKGIMAKVIEVITEYLFENFKLNRIYAEPFARNTGSRKALEKAGYRLEATLRSNVIKNLIIEDSCIYARLKNDEELNP